MTTNEICGVVLVYTFLGVAIGSVGPAVADLNDWDLPPGSAPAVCFIVGLFWPLALLAGLSWMVYRCVRSVVLGFVALWRHWRPAETLPRAVAKEKL